MSKEVTAVLTRCLQDLRLATVRSQYEAVARQATAETGSYLDFLRDMSDWEAVLIDDAGYVQQSREAMEVLFARLAERYERGSVLVTSNLAFSQGEQIFKDPMTTAAAIDRLVHYSVLVELNVA